MLSQSEPTNRAGPSRLPAPGLGVPCREAQADGTPCTQMRADCADCDKARDALTSTGTPVAVPLANTTPYA